MPYRTEFWVMRPYRPIPPPPIPRESRDMTELCWLLPPSISQFQGNRGIWRVPPPLQLAYLNIRRREDIYLCILIYRPRDLVAEVPPWFKKNKLLENDIDFKKQIVWNFRKYKNRAKRNAIEGLRKNIFF